MSGEMPLGEFKAMDGSTIKVLHIFGDGIRLAVSGNNIILYDETGEVLHGFKYERPAMTA